MTKTLTITEARRDLTKIVDRSNRLLEKYLITVNGKPEAVIMSSEEYDSLMETLDILSEPGALEEIRAAEEEIKAGKSISWEGLKRELNINV